MKSLIVCSMLLILVAACAEEDAVGPGRTVSTGVTPATQSGSGASTTSDVPTPTASVDATGTSALTETTVETLDPLDSLAYESVATASFPISLTPDPDFDRDLLMLRVGEVTDLETGEVLLDISDLTRTDSERGLLDAVVAPAELDSALFIHYSDRDGATTVSRFQREGDRFDRSSEEIVFQLDQPAGNHNGGDLAFANGKLYLGLGDGGGANDQFGNGQNLDTLLGGIVEIDPGSGDARLWAGGLRNPWRFWIDVESNTIAIADVGQNLLEEVSIVAFDGEFRNFGWPITEGLSCFSDSNCDMTGLVAPVLDVSHSDAGTCSITGGVTYRGEGIPEVSGQYFYSDLCGGWLRSVSVTAPFEQVDWTDQVGVPGQVVSFGDDRFGEMYVLTTTEVLKIVPRR